jgi:hypothetical protein
MIPFGRTQATVAEAAVEWGVSPQMVRNWIRAGKVQGEFMGRLFILRWPQDRPAPSTAPILRQSNDDSLLFPEE